MNELIRSKMHEALDAEPPPPGLRARVIGSIPIPDRAEPWQRRPRFQLAASWASGFIAALLAVAVIQVVGHVHGAIRGHRDPFRIDQPGNRVFRLLPSGRLVTIAGGGVGLDGKATKANL